MPPKRKQTQRPNKRSSQSSRGATSRGSTARKTARSGQYRGGSSRGSWRLGAVIAILLGINLYVFLWRGDTSIPAVMKKAAVAGDGGGALIAEKVEEAPVSQPQRVPQVHETAGTVGAGDSMGQLLRKSGLDANSSDELIRALSGHLDFRKIRVGQSYRLYLTDGKLTKFEFDISRLSKIVVLRGEDGKLHASKSDQKTEIRPAHMEGEIHGSLYQSIQDSMYDEFSGTPSAKEGASLVAFFVDVFAYDLNFYVDTHPGDSFRMVVEKEYLEGELIGYGRVLSAEYRGKSGTFQAFWWGAPGSKSGRYYNAEGQSLEKTLLKTPLKFARISSGFNPKRMHPVLHVNKGHWGTDYAAPKGTPIWAASAGKIHFRGRRGGAGNVVILKHDNGLETVYMHMSKFRGGQRVGQRVRAKEIIGYVGSTGLATGPHLHFGVKQNGRYVDPQKLKMNRSNGVPRKHMAQFLADIEEQLRSLDPQAADPLRIVRNDM